MQSRQEGLTKTYNRFHDPHELDEGIVKLRELHAEMDRVVLDSYGWNDLSLRSEFILNYEDEDAMEESTSGSRRKPWRLRWSDELRDEVLARLLELNKRRAEEERLAGIAPDVEAGRQGDSKGAPKSGRKKQKIDQPGLVGM